MRGVQRHYEGEHEDLKWTDGMGKVVRFQAYLSREGKVTTQSSGPAGKQGVLLGVLILPTQGTLAAGTAIYPKLLPQLTSTLPVITVIPRPVFTHRPRIQ